MATLRQRLRETIADETVGKERVGEVASETSFIDDLGADSLTVTQIIMSVEDLLDIEIPDDEAKGLATVDVLEQYLTGRGIDLDQAAK